MMRVCLFWAWRRVVVSAGGLCRGVCRFLVLYLGGGLCRDRGPWAGRRRVVCRFLFPYPYPYLCPCLGRDRDSDPCLGVVTGRGSRAAGRRHCLVDRGRRRCRRACLSIGNRRRRRCPWVDAVVIASAIGCASSPPW
ncbi:hypothetical protein B0T22DRAFT_469387 [Podospora appendiculata]|uniref:Uncharacterized protein n=1 Tax=Podospora appendiculata TaxID=314037 RepID=A0AAE0X3K4_9PEZI|nr:hypothetical protein B0T22DRAFT_469387 [Podospora appendiculata]